MTSGRGSPDGTHKGRYTPGCVQGCVYAHVGPRLEGAKNVIHMYLLVALRILSGYKSSHRCQFYERKITNKNLRGHFSCYNCE